jgi:hypothetical protein
MLADGGLGNVQFFGRPGEVFFSATDVNIINS